MQPSKRLVRSTVLIVMGMSAGIGVVASGANAQNVNGIFGIRSSEHFFQAGIDRMEQEIESLQDRMENDAEVLTIDGSVEDQRQDLEDDGIPVDPTENHFERGTEAMPHNF